MNNRLYIQNDFNQMTRREIHEMLKFAKVSGVTQVHPPIAGHDGSPPPPKFNPVQALFDKNRVR